MRTQAPHALPRVRVLAPLQVDVEADRLIFSRLAECSAVQAASSEEQPEIVPLPGRGYMVGRL